MPKTKLVINGEFIDSTTTKWIDVHDPVRPRARTRARARTPPCSRRDSPRSGGAVTQATNEVVTRVPQATQEEMREATKAAASAFKTWKQTTPLTRQRLMLDLQLAIRDQTESLAARITKEQGKTLVDARGDVLRGLRTHTSSGHWSSGATGHGHRCTSGTRVLWPLHVGGTRALGRASAFPCTSGARVLWGTRLHSRACRRPLYSS